MAFDFKKVLKGLGFSEEQIKAFEADGLTDDQEKALINTLRENFTEGITRDATFAEKHIKPASETSRKNVFSETTRKLISAFSLTDLSDEDKLDYNKVLAAAKKKMDSNINVDNKTLVKDYEDLKQRFETINEEHKTELQQVKDSAEAEKLDVKLESYLMKAIPKLADGTKKISSRPEIILPLIKNSIKEKYAVILDGNEIKFRDKKNPTLHVFKGAAKIEDNNILLTDLAKEYELFADVPKVRGNTKETIVINEDGGEGAEKVKFNSEGLQLAQKNLQRLEKAAAEKDGE